MKRRIFLRGAAGAALAAPYLSSVAERAAKAQSTAYEMPRRVVIYFTHNGCITNRWFPQVEDGPLSAGDLETTTLKPLASLADKVMIPRGLRGMNTFRVVQSLDPHDQATGSKLTCATLRDDDDRYANHASLDHAIANQINPNAAAPLVLSVGSATTSSKDLISFSEPGVAYPGTSNPTTIYNQLTGVFGGGGVVTEADYRVARGESVIDLVRGQLDSFERTNMSQADKRRVEDWKALLRSTEQQVPPTTCSLEVATGMGVTKESVAEATASGGGAGRATAYTAGADMMMQLMALNMICDANRALVLTYPGFVTFDWDGINHDANHHGLSHRNGTAAITGDCYPDVLDRIGEIDEWFAMKYARMVELFDSISEGEGTLLDNTATVWIPEISDGNAHNYNNLPIVQAGSCGGYFKTGQAIALTDDTGGLGNSEASCTDGSTNISFSTGSTGGNEPINKYYVALMNAVGCTAADGGKVTEFGELDSDELQAGITDPGEYTQLLAGN